VGCVTRVSAAIFLGRRDLDPTTGEAAFRMVSAVLLLFKMTVISELGLTLVACGVLEYARKMV